MYVSYCLFAWLTNRSIFLSAKSTMYVCNVGFLRLWSVKIERTSSLSSLKHPRAQNLHVETQNLWKKIFVCQHSWLMGERLLQSKNSQIKMNRSFFAPHSSIGSNRSFVLRSILAQGISTTLLLFVKDQERLIPPTLKSDWVPLDSERTTMTPCWLPRMFFEGFYFRFSVKFIIHFFGTCSRNQHTLERALHRTDRSRFKQNLRRREVLLVTRDIPVVVWNGWKLENSVT